VPWAANGICSVYRATALHGTQTRSSDSVRPSVRPYICPSNACTVTKRKKICPDFTIRKIIYHSFLRRMVARDDPFYLKILSQPAPIGAKSPIMNRYSLVAPQLQHLAKKVQLTLIGSPLSAFQRAQDEYCTLSLSPQRGAQKRKVSKIYQ